MISIILNYFLSFHKLFKFKLISLADIKKLEIEITQEERKERGKKLMKVIMRKWLPAADCLIGMMIEHLPSPAQAQKYRT